MVIWKLIFKSQRTKHVQDLLLQIKSEQKREKAKKKKKGDAVGSVLRES